LFGLLIGQTSLHWATLAYISSFDTLQDELMVTLQSKFSEFLCIRGIRRHWIRRTGWPWCWGSITTSLQTCADIRVADLDAVRLTAFPSG